MSWVYRRARFYRQTCRHANEVVSPPAHDRPDQRRTLGHGPPARTLPIPDRLPRQLRHGRRPQRRSTRIRRSQHPLQRRDRRPLARGLAAPDPQVPLRRRPLARSPGPRPPLGAAAQTPRERPRPPLVGTRQLRQGRASRARAGVRLHLKQVGLLGNVVESRPPEPPLLGEHNNEILADLASAPSLPPSGEVRTANPSSPLQGEVPKAEGVPSPPADPQTL